MAPPRLAHFALIAGMAVSLAACRRGHVAATLDAYSYGLASRIAAMEELLRPSGRPLPLELAPSHPRELACYRAGPRRLGPDGLAPFLADLASTLDVVGHRRVLVQDLDASPRRGQGRILFEVLGTRGGAPATVRADVDLELASEEGSWSLVGARVRGIEMLVQGRRRLVDRAREWGIASPHALSSPTYRTVAMPGIHSAPGCALGDLNGDGYPDLVIADGGRDRLYVNEGGERFVDCSVEAGFLPGGEGRGVVAFDQEGDGDLDVLVVNADREPDLYVNDGAGRFEERGRDLGILGAMQGSSAAVADVDGDGALDIFIACYGDAEREWPNLTGRNGQPDLLFVRRGERYVEMAAAAGVDEPGWGLAVAFADRDGDGDQDLYVANDFGRNALLENEGARAVPRFSEATGRTGTLDASFGMSVAWGDYDGDLDLDLYVGDYFWEGRYALRHRDFPMPPFPGPLLRPLVVRRLLVMTRGNALFRKDGRHYSRVAEEAGVAEAGWCWAAGFWDPDDDGDLDILAANGWITGPDPHDVALEFWTRMVSSFDAMEEHGGFFDVGERSLHGRERARLFVNRSSEGGGPTFTDAAWTLGIEETMDGRALAFGDVDRDGDQDAVVTAHMGTPALFLNERSPGTPGPAYLELRLRGAASGIGARAIVEAGGRRMVRHLAAGDTFLSSSEPVLHFGLGQHRSAVSVDIAWPDGRRTFHDGILPGRRYVVDEGDGAVAPDEPRP